jgi:pimeloyl-ACP methyl ester carboxylesterase
MSPGPQCCSCWWGSRAPVREAEVPTLVIGGAQDGLVPPDRVRRLAERLGADYLELDVAHNFSEEPAGVVVEDAVESWLRERSLLSPRTPTAAVRSTP